MDRLLKMDKEQFVSGMLADARQVLEQVADAVNDAPDGNVINASEMRVRDLMADLRRKAFEVAVQMRIDSTESSAEGKPSAFSPSEGRGWPRQAEQGAGEPQHAERQRTDRAEPGAVARRRGRQ